MNPCAAALELHFQSFGGTNAEGETRNLPQERPTLRESPNDVAIYPYTYIAVTHL